MVIFLNGNPGTELQVGRKNQQGGVTLNKADRYLTVPCHGDAFQILDIAILYANSVADF